MTNPEPPIISATLDDGSTISSQFGQNMERILELRFSYANQQLVVRPRDQLIVWNGSHRRTNSSQLVYFRRVTQTFTDAGELLHAAAEYHVGTLDLTIVIHE